MIKLNLLAKDKQQQLVLDYLQENVSEVLAEKINNGVCVTVDGKELINKKDLSLFMTYATGEARKLCEKGAQSTCVEDATVYGWAIHYFEEDGIHGKLFNLDGTEYIKETSKPTTTTAAKTTTVAKPETKDKQVSIFDFNLADTKEEEQEKVEEDKEEQGNPELEELETAQQQIQQVVDDYAKVQPFYRKYCELKREYMDCLVCYRLGDFYEFLDKDAVTASDILNLTLVDREVGLPERVPLAGVPYHAIDLYVQKLSAKYKVLVYDSEEKQYLVENGQRIDIATGETATMVECAQPIKQALTQSDENPHIRYLQSLVDNLRADLC